MLLFYHYLLVFCRHLALRAQEEKLFICLEWANFLDFAEDYSFEVETASQITGAPARKSMLEYIQLIFVLIFCVVGQYRYTRNESSWAYHLMMHEMYHTKRQLKFGDYEQKPIFTKRQTGDNRQNKISA